MNLQTELREGLHKMIEQIEDVGILQAVYVILARETGREEKSADFYDTLNPLLQASIERGLEQIKKGETVSHDEVKKRYDKWLK